MSHERHTFDSAIDLLNSKRPAACPNLGFITQLKLFEDMKYNINGQSQAHEKYQALKMTSAMNDMKIRWSSN
jgi:hypothetical protein